MTAPKNRWHERIAELFAQVCDLPEPDRAASLRSACADDEELRFAVERLLEVDSRSRGALDASVVVVNFNGAAAAPELSGLYRPIRRLGVGGFGEVWLAEQSEPLRRSVAVKIIRPGMDSDAVLARFEQERQALAVMDHPNVAKVFDAGVTPAGRSFFVMEYVAGEPITDFCDHHTFTIRQRLELFISVCEAVQHAHMKGIIHRDIKPSNILVTLDGERATPKVIDFGVAKAISHTLTEKTIFTEQGQLIGTPEYMSPEQASMGEMDIDTRTDVYSLGVVLYELLIGLLPFDSAELRAKGYAGIQRFILEIDPPSPSKRLISAAQTAATQIGANRGTDHQIFARHLRRELEWIPLKAMRKDRTRRFDTPGLLAEDIRRYLRGDALKAAPESRAYLARKFVRRNRVGVLVGVAFVLALSIGVLSTLLQANVAKVNERRANGIARRQKTIDDFLMTALRSGDTREGGVAGVTVSDAMLSAARRLDSENAPDDPETITALQVRVGEILLNNGSPDEARPLFERALIGRQRLHPGDHPSVAEALNDLGLALRELGRYAEAELRLEQASAMFSRCCPEEDPGALTALSNLGTILTARDKPEQGEVVLRRALAISRRVRAGDHLSTIEGLNDLGDALRAQGKTIEAAALFREALEASHRLYNGDHPQTALSMNNLACSLQDQNRGAEAEALLKESLKMFRRVYPRGHSRLYRCLTNLGTVRVSLGRPSDGEADLEAAVMLCRNAHRGDHPDTAQALHGLGYALHVQKRDDEASRALETALEIRRRICGGDGPLVISSLTSLAAVHEAEGRVESAERLMSEAIDMGRRVFPKGHSEVATSLVGLGTLRVKSGRASDAMPALEQAASMLAAMGQPDHPQRGVALATLAVCLYQLGKTTEARRDFDEAKGILSRLESPPEYAKLRLEEASVLTGFR